MVLEVRVTAAGGDPGVAEVFVGEFDSGRRAEFVLAGVPGVPRSTKTVAVLSSQDGCPVGCAMCDAGAWFAGSLDAAEIRAQLDWLARRSPGALERCALLKVHFARMGEPALNPAVLDVLEGLGNECRANLMPVISTVAPRGSEGWFARLREIRDRHFGGGMFQLQFSVHSTSEQVRDALIPYPRWTLEEIGCFGAGWCRPGDRLVTLNFALSGRDLPDPAALARHCPPSSFLVKLTPVNPTASAVREGLWTGPAGSFAELADRAAAALAMRGYRVLPSVGDPREDAIGSNCGMAVGPPVRGSWPAAAPAR
jgi:23S rRNA (adenine2503-C2)-methyltransferase